MPVALLAAVSHIITLPAMHEAGLREEMQRPLAVIVAVGLLSLLLPLLSVYLNRRESRQQPGNPVHPDTGQPVTLQDEMRQQLQQVTTALQASEEKLAVTQNALRDAQDAITGYLLMGADNTVRKQAEEALLKAGALQNAIFNSANFSSIATDAKGVIQIFNVGAERMLGYAAADVMNKITPADYLCKISNYITKINFCNLGWICIRSYICHTRIIKIR